MEVVSRVDSLEQQPHVLVVDDEPANVVLLERILGEAGYGMVTGLTDPRLVTEVVAEQPVDVLLLDLHMPGLDGVTVLQRLSQLHDEPTFIPTLVLTADASAEAKRAALEAGANDFLTKPFDVDEIVLRVGNMAHTRSLYKQVRSHSRRLETEVSQRTAELGRFRRVLDATRDPVVIQDPQDGRTLYINEAMRQLVGTWPEHDEADAARDPWPKEAAATIAAAAGPVLAGRVDSVSVEVEVSGPSADAVPLLVLLQSVREDDRRLLVAIARDLTQQKLQEHTLRRTLEVERQAQQRLCDLDDMKDTFLTAVSHELRTPLTVIMGMAETLQRYRTQLPEEQAERILERLGVGAKRLDRLLNDLLDLDRLTKGSAPISAHRTDVAAVVAERIARMITDGRETDQHLPSTQASVDPMLFERIVDNLLENVVKHTPPRSKLEVSIRPDDEGFDLVVEDHGPGVSDELKLTLFEPFRQAPQSRVPHSPGTGIGLSLVSAFVRLHNGRAWIEDGKVGGAAVHVRFPATV